MPVLTSRRVRGETLAGNEGLKMTSDNVSKLRRYARNMRSQPTEAEERLWGALRSRRLDRLKFRRQVPLRGFIVDFVCMEAKLVVEVDGIHHADSGYDARRDQALLTVGFEIVRFWNADVMRDLDSVCEHIRLLARQRIGDG
ncbi:MAG: endonuclease domain-containing protein [Pseudomonadota bacterium]